MEKKIGSVDVLVDGQRFTLDGDALTHLDYFRIKEHLLRYPADYAWVGTVKETLANQLAQVEQELEEKYANLDLAYRGQSDKEREVKSKITLTPEYKVLLLKLMAVKHTYGRVSAILKALEKFDFVLVQLSTMAKQEQRVNQ